jgi:hypothetical protein
MFCSDSAPSGLSAAVWGRSAGAGSRTDAPAARDPYASLAAGAVGSGGGRGALGAASAAGRSMGGGNVHIGFPIAISRFSQRFDVFQHKTAVITCQLRSSGPVEWQPKAAVGLASATSRNVSGGRGAGFTDRKPQLAAASSSGHTVGGWGAEDTDDDRCAVVQVMCDAACATAAATSPRCRGTRCLRTAK